jgi:hypothetical protein
LRKRKFFSLGEVNQAIAELLVRLNQRPFASAMAVAPRCSPNWTSRR